MRQLFSSLFLVLLCTTVVAASEIREFDLKTTERLGTELARVSEQADRGATDPIRKRAVETAKAAVKGKLFDGADYDYVVLDDPDGSGFLVYALASAKDKIVLGGHFRITVSSDGKKAQQVDALSRSLLFAPGPPAGSEGSKPITASMSQLVSNKPLETSVYTSMHDKIILSVGMSDGKVWAIILDKIFEMTPEMMKNLGVDEKKGGNN